MKRHPRHIYLHRLWPERYFAGLTRKEQLQREKELLLRRRIPYSKLGTVKGAATKKSKWTLLFHKTFPDLKFNKSAISRHTGISRSTLNTVYNRGLKAWKMSGSRPGTTAIQWAIARVYKYVLVTKHKAPKEWYETKFDPDQDLRKS